MSKNSVLNIYIPSKDFQIHEAKTDRNAKRKTSTIAVKDFNSINN